MGEAREFFEALKWRGVVLGVAVIAGFVALCFAPPAGCSLKVSSTPTTTTTTGTPHDLQPRWWDWDDVHHRFRCHPGQGYPHACDGAGVAP